MLSDVADLFEAPKIAPAADRRLTRRLIDAWARSARGRFPSWKALRERDLGDDWDWVFAVDLEKAQVFHTSSILAIISANCRTFILPARLTGR